MSDFTRGEIEAAYDRYVETRNKIEAGELGWDVLGEFFTDDATFIDPAWGRMRGRGRICDFLATSMSGLDDWSFPHEWKMVDGNRLVAAWKNRLPGQRDDGTYYEAQGISIMLYAGDGKFSYEEDLLNMAHIFQLIGECGWTPGPKVNMPPQCPER